MWFLDMYRCLLPSWYVDVLDQLNMNLLESLDLGTTAFAEDSLSSTPCDRMLTVNTYSSWCGMAWYPL